MARPSEIVREHCQDPVNAGPVENPDGVGEADLNGRAPRIRIEIRIRENMVTDFGFHSVGCGYMIAAGSVLSTLVMDKPVSGVIALTPDELETAMGGVSPHKRHCVALAIGALQAAITDSQNRERQ